MTYQYIKTLIILLVGCASAQAQHAYEEVGESMEAYIKENHLEQVENIVHKLAYSKEFLNQFLEKERHLHAEVEGLKKGDISIGGDVDIYVKHFTEHQNFTMILVPISIYSLAVYDTILFSVLEVSDIWLEREFPYDNFKNDSIKSSLLSIKNHALLAEHIYDQALSESNTTMGEVQLELDETFISTNTIHENVGKMTHREKNEFKSHWGLLKKAFTHNVDLNVEMNVYVFGFDDLEVKCKNVRGISSFRVTPGNIFRRHHFVEE
ncbi:hypothetical protein SAMN04488029_4018 [Reichenbachiella faecimaris]|uniref:DUF3887 domain-containing protein n=1 Tax=Reichenbachiella faecimaris TaxID=692418 RepID=A0A1W2GRJ7_REIFA|nr:hypothetical protein [Reichenbachiella faecimaris]SMD39042.1 hypothetical protein SAMN04488029_4018 [Reichenbachiella faecimaris]